MKGRMLVAATALIVLWRLATEAMLSGRWRRDERGDVPGWVMIVVLTAALVAGLFTIAGERLRDMLREALDSVTG